MLSPTEIVRDFYSKLSVGNAAGALELMARDIEWNTMWHYKVDGLGPEKVAEGLFKPLMAEWRTFALVADEFIAQGDTVVSLGHFTGVHGDSGKHVDAEYAHVWYIRGDRIQRFRQFIDTLAIANARS
jgi:ketosteroid isomerase-like protein